MQADNGNGKTVIDLLRHGEPVGGRRYRGQQDDALSERGWEQMWQAVGDVNAWQQIVTSPLQRCHAFATALAERHGTPVQAEPRFAEIGFGDWEGKTRTELEALIPGQLGRFYQDPVNNRPPGAEPLDDFVARVRTGFNAVLTAYPGQSVLVVAHAGVIRAILSRVLSMPSPAMYRINVANAGMTRLMTAGEGTINLVSHGSVVPEQ
ncbi:MAG TPA: histidine phosphatase family protein [Gammaproteobacteria bacterium]|nr:histidine phosphatase family protein [Gammaproteobacteria bacterium]